MSDRVLADELLREEALELLRLSRPQWYAAYQANVVEDRLQQAVARELRVKQGTVSKWVGKARREVDDYVERRKRGEATSPQPVARDLLGLARATGLSKDDLARIVLAWIIH